MKKDLFFVNVQLCALADVDRQNPMHPCFLLTLISKMEFGENVIFAKYGDGEYECIRGTQGRN